MLTNWIISAMMLFTAERPAVSVLCYHAFTDSKNAFCFSVDELKTQIEYLKSRGFRFVTYRDIVDGKIIGRKNILVTVDDGNKSVYRAYKEVFKPNGIKPVLGIYPAIIERVDYALTWAQLKELSDDGCEIAGHGYNHLIVRQKLYDKDKKAFMREIYLSKKILEEKLGRKIEAYIYPFGARSEITIEHLKKAGFSHAFTIVNGRIDIPLTGTDNYELPRYMLSRTTWESTFAVIDRKRPMISAKKPSTRRNADVKSKRRPARV